MGDSGMKILLVAPKTPQTFWSFAHAVRFVIRKSSEIPLGLITMASLLPKDWQIRLIDMNIRKLRDRDLLWADYVFLGGMNVNLESMKAVIACCNELDVKVVVGGPMATLNHRELQGVDHFVLNEAEATLPHFIRDLQNGCLKERYQSDAYPDVAETPLPRWDLLEMRKYATMSLQYSRGCPYNCEFCSIATLNGRCVRSKSREQFLAELESLYQTGWRRNVFIVDDNFIGNAKRLKTDILPALIEWMEVRDYPFDFTTEVSLNLCDDEELIEGMVRAGFKHTFIGIETPNESSLSECGKKQNLSRELVASIRQLQRKGLVVSGGFIVGFDHDPPDIFNRQIELIQRSGVVTAMVGLLNAPTGSRLYRRLQKENRLLGTMSGNNLDGSTNFIPKMNYKELILGYKKILRSIYAPHSYFERVKRFLDTYELPAFSLKPPTLRDIYALFRSMWKLGIWEQERRYYWKLLFRSLLKYPRKFPLAVTMAIYGFHFRKVAEAI